MDSKVFTQLSFVSTFLKEREKATTHSYLKTKPNRTKTPTRRHALAQASFNDLLSSHSTRERLHTSKVIHKSPETKELTCIFNCLSCLSKWASCQLQSTPTCAIATVTHTPRADPLFFHLFFWRPQDERMWSESWDHKPSSGMRNTPAQWNKSEKLPTMITCKLVWEFLLLLFLDLGSKLPRLASTWWPSYPSLLS